MILKPNKSHDLPSEKALLHGIQSLSDVELIALLLRSGTKQYSVFDIAQTLIRSLDSLHQFHDLDFDYLKSIKGISDSKALLLLSVSELSKRIAYSKIRLKPIINSASQLGEWLNSLIGFEKQEHFVVVFLDIKNQIIHYKKLFIGTLNASIVHPREVFKEAMRCSAHALIIAHNHPSGNVEYSNADVEVTKKLIKIGYLCGIPIIDHVIVGKNNVFSFREHQIVQF